MKINGDRKQRIEYKLDQANDYLDQLEELLPERREDYLNDAMKQRAGERIFEIIVQIVIDTCTKIVTLLQVSAPETYAECIQILEKSNIIPEEQGK